MSKYTPLWLWIRDNGSDSFKLSFQDINKIAGIPLDHSFLKYKKELEEYGFQVAKISMKDETVLFKKKQNYENCNIGIQWIRKINPMR